MGSNGQRIPNRTSNGADYLKKTASIDFMNLIGELKKFFNKVVLFFLLST